MKTLSTLLVTLFCSGATAQIFPVQVTTQLIPPYSPYLADYTAPGADNLRVRIRANDLSLIRYPCRLRLTIEGVGMTIRTRADFHAEPFILQGGGTPEIFYGSDLAEYFNPKALEFSGYSRNEYEKTGRLPEGFYRISVEVLDYYRGTVVSNKGTAAAWIMLNDPPLLNLPADHAVLPMQDPTHIVFSWTPRHSASPNAALTTEYIFRLAEVWSPDRNPDDAFLTGSILFETITTENRLHYSSGEPQLIPGRTYAWQVTARDTGGKDLFRNDGHSEVFVFQFGDPLPVPQNFHLRWAKPTTLAIRWDAVSEDPDIKYRLQYRPRKRGGDDTRRWYETRTKFTDKTLYHLQSDTEYEARVRAEKPGRQSDYTETLIFKTLRPEQEAFVCRDNVIPPPHPDNTTPLFPLSVNDTLHAAGYSVLVRDVIQANGKYSGSGVVIVPWLNSARVRVTFENIRVNDSFWLTRGTINTRWSAGNRFFLDTQTPTEPGMATPKTGELDITIVSADSLITLDSAIVTAVTKDEAGDIVIATNTGGEQRLVKGESYAVADAAGNGYIIDEQGNVAKTTATEAQAAAARGDRTYAATFEFERGDGLFGFDRKEHDALSRYYQQLEDGSYVPWKALASTRPDLLYGHLNQPADPVRRIKFLVGASQIIPIAASGQSFTLNLQGKAAGMEQELLATYPSEDSVPGKVLGKINLVTYNLIRYNLVIVPVNGVYAPGTLTAGTLSEKLNGIYHQAVVEWNVTLDENLSVPLDDTFDDGGTGVFSHYTPDMKKVLQAYGRLQPNTFYLFLIDKPRNPAALGYMPRNRQAGFIFVAPHQGNTAEFIKTVAHELGHGAFNLKHTFSEHALPIGTTGNLMDYSDGTAICKYQWDAIHSPQTVLGLFDEEGEIARDGMTAEQMIEQWHALPPYKKAAEILHEHLEDTGAFKEVSSTCDDSRCLITATFGIGEDIDYTMEVTFTSTMSADELLSTLAFEYRVDLWEAFNVKSEDIWDELYFWWRKQNDDLAQHKGWQVSTINFLADVITAPTMVPAVEGWITGKHCRDGHELAGWEQALAALDFLAAEEITKGCITKLAVTIGGKTLRLLKVPLASRALISKAIAGRSTVTVVSETEFIINAVDGTRIARIVDNGLYILNNGREIAINVAKRTALLGRYGGGTKNFLLAQFDQSKFFNMLNIKGWSKATAAAGNVTYAEASRNALEFWQLFNKSFIDDVIASGDDIVFLHRADDLRNLFYSNSEARQYIDVNGKLLDVALSGDINKDIKVLLSMNAFPTMFGREVMYLSQKLGLSIEELTLKFYR